jgi:transcriptional regulator with XRE-family HTH domain
MPRHIDRGIGDAVRRAREDAGYTQHELARLTGTTQATVSGIERGAIDARLSTLQRIATVLNGTIAFVSRSAPRSRPELDAPSRLSLRQRFAVSDDEEDDEASS